MIEVTNEALAKAIQKSKDDGRSINRISLTGGDSAWFECIINDNKIIDIEVSTIQRIEECI